MFKDIITKQKLEKYLAYLSNAKYLESVLKSVLSPTRTRFEKAFVVFVVSSKKEAQLLKEIHLYEKIRAAGLEIVDLDGASNLVI